MFTERKIPAFQRRIADLPDTPTLTASELKARFDACPEELRQALNGVCDDGKALENRIDAYRAQTFEGEITELMLDNALSGKINGKADAKENNTAHRDFQTQITAKCEIVTGMYEGSGEDNTQTISLGFTPAAVLVAGANFKGNYANPQYMNLAVTETNAANIKIVSGGFQALQYFNQSTEENQGINPFRYIAFR